MKKIICLALITVIALSTKAQHVVVLKTGEKMNGKVESLKDDVISFLFKGNTMKLNVAEVSSILFNEAAESPKSSGGSQAGKEPGEKQIVSGSYLIRYKVADRKIVRTPTVSNLTQEKGTVTVDVTIDKYGQVRKAVPGGKSTTTTSEYLLTKAKQAAESALFDNVPNAPLEQKGYIIIVF